MLRHFLRDPSAVTGATILFLFVVGAVLAPLIAPQNPYDLEALSLADSLKPPIWMEGGEKPFLLGTDEQGRDVLSTILYGCRTSLTVAFGVVLVAGTFGMVMGLLAGFYGGLIDAVVMRLADVFYSFSTTLMAILVLGLLKRKGVPVLILAISLTDWVRYARTLRGAVLAIQGGGLHRRGPSRGSARLPPHLPPRLPNAVPPLLVVATVDFGVVIMLEATLSFLGVGLPVTEPSLGMMIAIGRKYVYAGKWWLIVFPGVALTAIVVGINLVADWLREEINPRIQKAVKGR